LTFTTDGALIKELLSYQPLKKGSETWIQTMEMLVTATVLANHILPQDSTWFTF
jgi:hypothetical protein